MGAPTKEVVFEEAFQYSNFESSIISHSFTRWKKMLDGCIEFKGGTFGHPSPTHKGLCVGGVTVKFGKAIADLYSDRLQAFMKGDGQALVPPIRFQIAGGRDTDGLVMNDVSEDFCTRASRCTVSRYPESKHGILIEIDSIRKTAINEIVDFFKLHKTPVPTPAPTVGLVSGAMSTRRTCFALMSMMVGVRASV